MKILIMTYCNKEALEISLGMLTGACNIANNDIIIASLNAGDAVNQYLISQGQYRYILADESDSYGAVINVVINDFLGKGENLAILNEGMTCFPDTLSLAEEYLLDENVGAVIFDKLSAEDGEYASLCRNFDKKNLLFPIVGHDEEGLIISKNMLLKNGLFDERYFNSKNTLVDYIFTGGQNGYKFYKASDCLAYVFCSVPINKKQHREIDVIRDKWGMNYFTYLPNKVLIETAPEDFKGDVNVLEIGCDCGGNGVGIKEIYPYCHLYGMELNPNSAKIAARIYDEVVVGNAEEMELPFENVKFDIVMFGDVLEHLRDPFGMLKKCYDRMNDGGVVIASIPNIMHYTVMRQLINGRFQYENEGLLDKTHVHFFTFNEIVKMFNEVGFTVEGGSSTIVGEPSEDDKKMIDTLLSLSKETNRKMYETFQYNVRARKNEKA